MTIDQLTRTLHEGGYTLVLQDRQGQLHTYQNRGVKDLYQLLTSAPDLLKGAMIADKVVGKGAAALMVMGGVKVLHTDVVSSQALLLLQQSDIQFSYGERVDYIINRTKDGWCPVEKLCKDAPTAEACLPLISSFISNMKH